MSIKNYKSDIRSKLRELKFFVKEYSKNIIIQLSNYEKALDLSQEQKQDLTSIDSVSELADQTILKIDQIFKGEKNENTKN